MKNFLILTLSLFVILSFTNSTVDVLEVEKSTTNDLKEVVSIHEFTLLPGVDPTAFEAFILKKAKPLYNAIDGQHFQLVKGDRGNRTGKYSMILSFDKVGDRDRIYPKSGDSNVDWGDDKVWEELLNFVNPIGAESSYTDYIEIQ